MLAFSASLTNRGLPTQVTSQRDVDTLIDSFRADLKALNLWQYYVFDVKGQRQQIKEALDRGQVKPWSGEGIAHKNDVDLARLLKDSGLVQGFGQLGKRYGTTVDPAVAAGIAKAVWVDYRDNHDALADSWTRIIDILNVPQYQEWEEDTKIALDSIKNRLTYARLDEHGPKMGPITAE